ncbi:MAG: hypothetical protein JWQ20_3869 [Conexibacter sp.]|nr:hypothetical protein [Conexibacter sp.]
MSRLRVLMPQRFDLLSRAMDTNIVAQWQFLAEAVDLVLWGPGLDGFAPGKTLDQVAADVDADVILLPDLHHAIPELWDELWRGAERAPCPVVWHLVDQASWLEHRRAVIERVRPDALLLSYSRARIPEYEDLIAAHDIVTLSVPWGFDNVLFGPADPARAVTRDIDLLIAGAAEPEPVYRMRARVQTAARMLAGRWNVVDLGHPGYWESGQLAAGRGQAQFADLLRRTKLATTGAAFGGLPRKYWESAACGAIGVGDLPAGEPDADRFVDCSLVVDPHWDEARIAFEMDALLRDRDRLAALSAAGPGAVAGCDHRERAHDYAAALASVVRTPIRAHRPRPFPAPAPALLVIAAPEPESVPSPRRDWHDAWRAGPAGASRTRRVEAVLAGSDADVCVVALDPDAARHVDALVLASTCRASGAIAVRPAADAPDGSFALTAWAAIAAPRAALLQELQGRRGRFGVEEAIGALGVCIGVELGPEGAFRDVAADLARLCAVARVGLPVDQAALRAELRRVSQRALTEGRNRTAREIYGMACLCWDVFLDPVAASPDGVVAAEPQDPELETPLVAGAAFAIYAPQDPACLAPIAGHAALGPAAPPLQIGVPATSGVMPSDVLATLARDLEHAGIDLDASADLVLLERPLWDAEIAWLAARCPAPLGATSSAATPVPTTRL